MYSGGTAHPVHRTAANAIQFQIDQQIPADAPMVVDIGGKLNTFRFLDHGRTCTGLK